MHFNYVTGRKEKAAGENLQLDISLRDSICLFGTRTGGVGSPMTGIGMTGLCHPRFFGMRTVTTTASGDSSRETLASTPPERRSSTPRETVL